MIGDYVDQHRQEFGLEPMCAALTSAADVKIAPGTYCATKSRPLPARGVRDDRVWVDSAR